MNGQGIYTQKYPDIRAIAFGFSEVYLQIVALKEFPSTVSPTRSPRKRRCA